MLIETAVYTAANGQTVATVDEVAGIRFQSNTPNNEMATVGMRMMISNNFAPKTRLRMASRLLIMEVQISIIFCMGVHLTPVCTGFKENELDRLTNGTRPLQLSHRDGITGNETGLVGALERDGCRGVRHIHRRLLYSSPTLLLNLLFAY